MTHGQPGEHQTKAASYKKEQVAKVVQLLKEYPIIGIANMENLPASALQQMRGKLRGRAEMFMTKRRLIHLALQEAEKGRKGILQLDGKMTGMPALLFTKENPFSIYRIIKKSKSPAYAKAGQQAPHDIVVKAGPTPFAPGPVIGEFGAIGVKAGVEGGKVAVKADTVVAKSGEKIKPKVAEILARLGIQPMEVGLDLTAVYENGIIYQRDILSVDDREYLGRLSNASRWSFNLAMFAAYPTKMTMKHLIGRASNDARALGRAR